METARTAACVAVGSEMLGASRLDTNSLTVARALARCGYRLVEKRVVGDSTGDIVLTLRQLVDRVDAVVVTGGLGPTADDVTLDALAEALGRPLAVEDEVVGWIRERYAALGRTMPEAALRMARVVAGSRSLRNSRGSAPGVLVDSAGCLLVALPGVPWEMETMLERDVVPELVRRNPGASVVSRTLVLGGVVESEVESRVCHLYQRFGRENVTILASPGVVRLVLQAGGGAVAAAARLGEMEAAFAEVVADDLAGVDVGGLEEVVVRELVARAQTLATAESCTGGLVSAALTSVPGSSECFLGGVVSYSNMAKESFIGVPRGVLEAHGAVSEPVALAMAAGARGRFGADWGVGVTGIAGPGGGTAEKPVGLVHWAVAGPGGSWHRQRVIPGDRAVVRQWSVNAVLDLLLRGVHKGDGW